jgi:hypothetical protein
MPTTDMQDPLSYLNEKETNLKMENNRIWKFNEYGTISQMNIQKKPKDHELEIQ